VHAVPVAALLRLHLTGRLRAGSAQAKVSAEHQSAPAKVARTDLRAAVAERIAVKQLAARAATETSSVADVLHLPIRLSGDRPRAYGV